MKLSIKHRYLCLSIALLAWLPGAMAQENAIPPGAESAPAVSSPVVDVAPPSSAAPLAVPASADRDAVCTRCHDENENKPILSIYQTKHGVRNDPRTPSCQSCHGLSEKHLHGDPAQKGRASPDVIFGSKKSTSGSFVPSEPAAQNKVCLSCHEKDERRSHWQGGQHQLADLACTSCHQVHTAHDKVRDKKTQPEVCYACHKEQRADSHKMSTHPIDAGKVVCSDCHNPHGSAGPKLLKKNTVTETCYTCHAEKRGPFLWEHQPATEDCTNCHTPHGSNISSLLKSRPPFLCQECHDGPHNSKSPAANNGVAFPPGQLTAAGTALAYPSTQAAARGCMNCHSMVHGSNSPAGAFLHR